MHFRQLLPDGVERSGFAAADGQMGQIVHAYLDWSLSGDIDWLRRMWPRIKKALEFAWIPGGWDANKDGVLEGVQHNTYDVEFYGPNPMCGIYYLAALRAGEEMARAVGDDSSAAEYRRLFESGSQWIDANLIQRRILRPENPRLSARQDRAVPAQQHGLRRYRTSAIPGRRRLPGRSAGRPVSGRSRRARPAGLRKTTSRRRSRPFIATTTSPRSPNHDTVQRTFALNNEAAMVICDYGKAERPRIPFPYYAEVMTGFEYSTAAHMLYAGMIREGIECIANIRARYDGLKRNPWDEAECGHHYARAMAAWSGVLALSGFRYHAPKAAVVAMPRVPHERFTCFWSTATGWGTFSTTGGLEIKVLHGTLSCRSCEFPAASKTTAATLDGKSVAHGIDRASVRFSEPVVIPTGGVLKLRA